MTDRVDTIVVGAGVIGLACARSLARRGHEVIVLERATEIGSGTSSRNSEVIHAGLYYPNGSLKARLCVAGKWALYDYCRTHGVPHANLGKLIVAADEAQVPKLEALIVTAAGNGVDDLTLIDGAAARAMEPALKAAAALHSPSTGIVDSHGLMRALQGEIEDRGGVVALGNAMDRAVATADGLRLTVTTSDGDTAEIACTHLINAAGLNAWQIAAAVEGLAPTHVPSRYLSRGVYFTLTGKAPFGRLIYPVPEAAGLGIHLTLDLGGQARFGPDTEWVETEDYTVDPTRGEAFYAAIRRYYPALPDGALQPGYAGIRPKLQAPGEPAADFRIDTAAVHGIPGLVNLFGIESPGLTAALALGEHVADGLAA